MRPESLQSVSMVTTSLPSVRIRRRKLQPGETATEQPMTDPLLRFKVEFFYPIVDVCVTQLHDRLKIFITMLPSLQYYSSVFLKFNKSRFAA